MVIPNHYLLSFYTPNIEVSPTLPFLEKKLEIEEIANIFKSLQTLRFQLEFIVTNDTH